MFTYLLQKVLDDSSCQNIPKRVDDKIICKKTDNLEKHEDTQANNCGIIVELSQNRCKKTGNLDGHLN